MAYSPDEFKCSNARAELRWEQNVAAWEKNGCLIMENPARK